MVRVALVPILAVLSLARGLAAAPPPTTVGSPGPAASASLPEAGSAGAHSPFQVADSLVLAWRPDAGLAARLWAGFPAGYEFGAAVRSGADGHRVRTVAVTPFGVAGSITLSGAYAELLGDGGSARSDRWYSSGRIAADRTVESGRTGVSAAVSEAFEAFAWTSGDVSTGGFRVSAAGERGLAEALAALTGDGGATAPRDRWFADAPPPFPVGSLLVRAAARGTGCRAGVAAAASIPATAIAGASIRASVECAIPGRLVVSALGFASTTGFRLADGSPPSNPVRWSASVRRDGRWLDATVDAEQRLGASGLAYEAVGFERGSYERLPVRVRAALAVRAGDWLPGRGSVRLEAGAAVAAASVADRRFRAEARLEPASGRFEIVPAIGIDESGPSARLRVSAVATGGILDRATRGAVLRVTLVGDWERTAGERTAGEGSVGVSVETRLTLDGEAARSATGGE